MTLSLTERLESAVEATRRLKPFPKDPAEVTYYAKDWAEVTVFLDTVLPDFLADLKSVTEDI